jgi:FtsZ-binding cell division protein ZapB
MDSFFGEKQGEDGMTDFQTYKIERDARETEMRHELERLRFENETLRKSEANRSDSGMTDYQFKTYGELRDKCEELSREITALRKENEALKRSVNSD